GYLSAMVQLHFQDAKKGEPLPDAEGAVLKFHGQVGAPPASHMERLLDPANENKAFNGQGQMIHAFHLQAGGWKGQIKKRAKKTAGRGGKPNLQAAEAELRKERDREHLALLAWIRAGSSKEDWDNDKFCLPKSFPKTKKKQEFFGEDKDGPVVNIKS